MSKKQDIENLRGRVERLEEKLNDNTTKDYVPGVVTKGSYGIFYGDARYGTVPSIKGQVDEILKYLGIEVKVVNRKTILKVVKSKPKKLK